MTRFFTTDDTVSIGATSAANENEMRSGATPDNNGGNTHTGSVPAGQNTSPAAYWTTEDEVPHDHENWPTTGYQSSINVTVAGDNITYQLRAHRFDNDFSIRSTFTLLSGQSGTGIKATTLAGGWPAVNTDGNRQATDTLIYDVLANNSAMMGAQGLTVLYLNDDSWVQNVNFSPPSTGPPSGHGEISAVGSLVGDGSTTASGHGEISAEDSLDGDGTIVTNGSGDITAIGSLDAVGLAPVVPPTGGGGQIASVASVDGSGLSHRIGHGDITTTGILEGVGNTPPVGVASGHGDIDATGSLEGVGLTPTFFDPANLNVITDGSTAQLTWDEAITPGVVDYSVFRRSPQTGEPFDPNVDTPVATGILIEAYDDEDLEAGNYDWQVFGRIPG